MPPGLPLEPSWRMAPSSPGATQSVVGLGKWLPASQLGNSSATGAPLLRSWWMEVWFAGETASLVEAANRHLQSADCILLTFADIFFFWE